MKNQLIQKDEIVEWYQTKSAQCDLLIKLTMHNGLQYFQNAHFYYDVPM